MLPMQYIQLRVARRKLLAATYLVVILPVYPLVYFLGAFNVLEKDIVSLTILFLNFVGKTLYAVSVMDVHTEILDPNSFHLMAERRANDSRRAFLRCKATLFFPYFALSHKILKKLQMFFTRSGSH